MFRMNRNLLVRILGFHRTSSYTAHSTSASRAIFPNCISKQSSQLIMRSIKGPHTSRRWLNMSRLCSADIIDVEGPAFAESITEGDIRWIKKKGDHVSEDELVAEIETDKTTVEVPAPQEGIIEELLVPDGSRVDAKQKIYRLRVGEGATAAAGVSASSREPVAAPVEQKLAEKVEEQPLTSQPPPQPQSAPTELAGEIPLKAPPVPPVPKGPMSTRSTSEFLAERKAFQPPAQENVQATGVPSSGHVEVPSAPSQFQPGDEKAITGVRTETRVRMNRMRQRIAQRLKDAQNTYAMLTTFNEVDMSAVLALRAKYKEAFLKQHGVKLGFMSPFLKAAAYALADQPVVNAYINDQQEIVYRHYVDVSVAVASPRGLVVPVIRNAEVMNLGEIEVELERLALLARDNKLAVEDMEGGTFTISNGGVFGSLFGTPIINPPQSAILGIHAIQDKPVAIEKKVEIRPMMVVALTYDHRLIDGREAVTFLRKIKQAVEDPSVMILNL